ncbi:MAG: TIGR03089 family protein [Aeromicrobium erythreum]
MTRSPATLPDLLPLRRDPAAPAVTFYDGSTGERVELSGTTLANWVAKTAGFLVDEVEVGTRLRIGLPSHWLRPVWLLAAWSVGAVVVDRDAAVGLSGPELVADEPVRLAASLRPLGGPFAEPPAGFVDVAREVPGQPDVFVALDPPAPTSPALDLAAAAPRPVRLDHAGLLAAAPADDARLLLQDADLVTEAIRLVAALSGAGSLVLVVRTEPEAVARIAEQEQARIPTDDPLDSSRP